MKKWTQAELDALPEALRKRALAGQSLEGINNDGTDDGFWDLEGDDGFIERESERTKKEDK